MLENYDAKGPHDKDEEEESIHDTWYTRDEEPDPGHIPDAWRGTYGDDD